ncbi:MAG: hypothetical protein OEW39_07690, partial [Deltaproteobacteria bacterium]|nr:hypothetical protein [Deltaproteobacteria bacterium]
MTAPLASATGTRLPLAPIFIVSLVAVGFEIALTRYFAMANWSEYGYWVISITMVGFATSGVVLSLFETWFAPRANPLLSLIPVLLILAGALGYHLVALNPFNPLELQNPLLYKGQLVNIAKYYGALFPYYFLTGLYIGLSFLRFQDRIPAVYGADLAGAGLGAGAVLLLMFLVHPFYLLVWLLPLLPLAVWLFPWYGGTGPRWRLWAPLTALLGAELLLLGFNPAEYNTYKAIYPALNVENNRVLTSVRSPRGYFQVLDNFTERLDTDFSNNIGMLRLPGPPATLGVYRDGNRIGSLPKAETGDPRYAEGALDAGPYRLLNQPSVLLVGTRGGFRVAEALHLGARSVTALEPDVTLRTLVTQGINGAPHPSLQALSVRVSGKAPADLLNSSGDRFELIDISSDYLGQSFANRFVFTREAVALMLDRLAGDGVLSLPVSIQEFTLYGVKLLETVRSALSQAGYDRPEEHITVFRSAWNVRILASPQPFTPARLQPLLEFCNERSFDVSYYPGMDPAGLEVWNDLPQVSFEEERVLPSAPGGSDALREQALAILGSGRDAFLKRHFFDLSPATHDRPYFHYILRPEKLGAVLKRIMLLPREEIGYLVNIAVLAQSLVLAVLVMFLPLLRWR